MREQMGYQVRVDKDVCISSGKCVADAPAAFRFDDDEIAEPTTGVSTLSGDLLVEIVRNCPSGAIRLFEQGVEVAVD
ncbi:ferredoxin [Streptosporangium amethystogenes subsp. fukuiense]|uniref:Ferredoxin n=1 Tax=Streptosporangium amethystogenes subsp. fukuiense TaxID=698418 RepID=A0ABW2TAU4_9ACTN